MPLPNADPDANLKPTATRTVKYNSFFKPALTVNAPLAKQVIAPPKYYHLESLVRDGVIRIETNFKMR